MTIEANPYDKAANKLHSHSNIELQQAQSRNYITLANMHHKNVNRALFWIAI